MVTGMSVLCLQLTSRIFHRRQKTSCSNPQSCFNDHDMSPILDYDLMILLFI